MRRIIRAYPSVQRTARRASPAHPRAGRDLAASRPTPILRALHAAMLLAAATGLTSLTACSGGERPAGEPSAHAPAADAPFERGPHGGRQLVDGDFALELAIFEDGTPPELRAHVHREGEPLDPASVDLQVVLRRIAGRVDRIGFRPAGDHLRGDRIIDDPHSFDVEVVARENGREHRFTYSSYENRVTLDPEQLEAAGVRIEAAGPAVIHERIVLHGHVIPREDGWARIASRFPGIVRAAPARLGQSVARGDLLARVESNQSLQAIELRAPFDGVVVAKDAAAGEVASPDRALFEVADLSSVVVELDVYRGDFGRVAPGQHVRIDPGDGSPPLEAVIDSYSPMGSPWTQTRAARAIVANAERRLHPGLFTRAEVDVGSVDAAVTVRLDAIQRLSDRDVVFVADGGTFEAQPVELGRSDGERVEIVSGLAPGQPHVVAGSFVLKAEAGKSGASHDH